MTSPAAIRIIEEQLEKVAIHLTWCDSAGNDKHGTAFFVNAAGIALTAFHNIEDTLAANPPLPLKGTWQGRAVSFAWKLPEPAHDQWQRERDIAVLQAEDLATGLEPGRPGYLPSKVSDARRSLHWSGSHVVVTGFARGHRYNLAPGDGYMRTNPLCTVEIGKGRYQALKFGSSQVNSGFDDGPGMSGSPVYSLADSAIVGVTIAAGAELLAAELWPVYDNWEGSHSFMVELPVRGQGHPPPPRPPKKRGKWAALALCLPGVAVAGWMLSRQAMHTIPRQLSAQVSRIDSGTTEAVTDGLLFKSGEHIRFHFTAPSDGHLYVVDQEIFGGQEREPRIIFPTLRTSGGRNRVKAGMAVDFPSEDDVPPYLQASAPDQPGYEGEKLTVLIFPDALPVTLKETPVPLEPALFSLNGLRTRSFIHPLAPPADALAIRRIRLRIGK